MQSAENATDGTLTKQPSGMPSTLVSVANLPKVESDTVGNRFRGELTVGEIRIKQESDSP